MNTMLKNDLKIRVYFFWRAYPRQSSLGLIGGLMGRRDLKVDCDACALPLKAGRPIGQTVREGLVYYENETMFDGAIRHGGDNLQTDKNTEYIEVDLAGIPGDVDEIQFIFNIFKEEELVNRSARLHRITIRIKEAETLSDLMEVEIKRPDTGHVRAFSGCSLVRKGEGWEVVRRFRAFQEAKTFQDLLQV